MNPTWEAQSLLNDQKFLAGIPPDLRECLYSGNPTKYLDAISRLALDPIHTTRLFILHEDIFVEICNRWILKSQFDKDFMPILSALARILPLAPYVSQFAKTLLQIHTLDFRKVFNLERATGVRRYSDRPLHHDLLTIFRLLVFNNGEFASVVVPAQMQILMTHTQRPTRYLAIKILCLYLHVSDEKATRMIRDYVGDEAAIEASWESRIIDYQFLSLWEEKRLNETRQSLDEARAARTLNVETSHAISILKATDLSLDTARFGDVLLTRREGTNPLPSSLVITETVKHNMSVLAKAFKESNNILVTGLPGAGKSSIIRDLTRELCISSSTITIYANEQTDVKLLLGVYTSGESPGSFRWRPGVLTQAVSEGYCVVVEDIDKAPAEIISTLLPLLERGELFVPNRDETLVAAPGFKLIATTRSVVNTKGDVIVPGSNNIGYRHWTAVPMLAPEDEELAQIVAGRYAMLRPYISRIMAVYKSLQDLDVVLGAEKPSMRHCHLIHGLRELLRWCKRLNQLLSAAGVVSGHESISESTNDAIFLEAVDCFAGHLPSGAARASYVDTIAQILQIPAERVEYCLRVRKPKFSYSSTLLTVGRASLAPECTPRPMKGLSIERRFAMTKEVLTLLESVGVAIQAREACLLVGETGTGKTALVQYLAGLLHKNLVVINLSQQSELGDLLGGYKPVSPRALASPIMRHFEDLFKTTFSTKRNERFLNSIAKAANTGRWERVLSFWQEALRMFRSIPSPTTESVVENDQQHRLKRRKIDLPRYQALKSKWTEFESEVRVFKMHLASGSKGFAFSFVEGNIVQAARNGDWVLLDEINLASPDTLESLADLLSAESDGGPSLLLPESGRAERIYAHESFRIFGAMNPATDIGKRDLPAGIRSRFTELCINPLDRELASLVMVIKEYLGDHGNTDLRAPADVANLYIEVKRLAARNALFDGSGQKPYFSLRTLTRALIYVRDITHIYNLRRALFEGFSMSFLTVLSAESGVQVLSLIEKHIINSHKNGRAYMKQIPRPPEEKTKYIQFRQYWIAQGSLPTQQQPHYILTPFVERNLLNLVRATSTRRFPILLQGPTSSGKTSMIEYLARISGNKFLRVNNHEHTDIQEYFGTYVSQPDGSLEYQDGVLVSALREGSWIVLDELNLAPTDVLEALNRLLDDNKELLVPETQEIIRPHQDFMLFATQNPPGSYGGRKVLSRALRNRFLELHFDDIPEEELETILKERCRVAPSFCTRIVSVYRKLSIIRQKGRLFEQKNSFATLRDLFRWALRDADDREQLATNGYLLLAERVRDADERLAVKQVLEEVMKVSIDEKKIYDIRRKPGTPTSSTNSTSSTVWTASMLRSYVLVTEALKHNEPVLLVGDTGSGKTTVCQVVAEQSGKQLYTVNAHQNMDTSDMIGSQRPVRNKGHLALKLTQDLTQILRGTSPEGISSHELPALLSAYDALQNHERSTISIESRGSIEAMRHRYAALFEWADGSIVKAMRAGQHLLLDEISLADDSVLERLNSILEPSRTLFLAERATDTKPIVASPGFQIYATMNPGGDYGKKELSPALRNRFTEIWVPPVVDGDELLAIASANLAEQLAHLAPPMIAFATWYGDRYNPIAPAISTRNLLSWVLFVNRFGLVNNQFAVLQGAALVYVDALGADPMAKTWIANESISVERACCLSKLGEIFQFDAAEIYSQEPPIAFSGEALSIGPFRLKIHHQTDQDSSYSFQAPTTKSNIVKIVRALQVKSSILLEGSPGVGKTTLITAIARAVGIPLTRINLSDQTDLTDLFGSDVPLEDAEAGQFGWRQAPFLKAMQNGEWLLLDEMNLASQSVLEGLNACLDHRGQVYIPELDQTFSRHRDFVVFAAQNPRHQGGGRKGLPASFVDRFIVVYIEEFKYDDLLMICSQAFPECSQQLTANIVDCIISVSGFTQRNSKASFHGGPWEFNLRDAFRWLQILTSRDSLRPAINATDYIDLLFLQRFRTLEDRTRLSSLMQQTFPGINMNHRSFVNVSKDYLQVGIAILPRNKHALCADAGDGGAKGLDLSIVESVMFSVQNRWPCLLVGPSGSGKTRTIKELARLVGSSVVTIALNVETDIIDLVGGFEQVDPHRHIMSVIKRLRVLARQMIASRLWSRDSTWTCVNDLEQDVQQVQLDLPQLKSKLRQCALTYPDADFGILAEELDMATQHAHEDGKARFEWVDGILVNALRDGAWLVLDNANLCNPSILDRLNSLLEPNGFLNINEHRATDGSSRVIKPHKDFRLFLTMDPRYGELSRAMRNRSVELFLLNTPQKQYSRLMLEASLSRFAIFNDFQWDSLQGRQMLELSRICHDHLAFSDILLSVRWREQIGQGLLLSSSQCRDHFSFSIRSFDRMLSENAAYFEHIQKTYQGIVNGQGTAGNFFDIGAQNIHPLNNPLIIRFSTENKIAHDLPVLGYKFDLLWRACCFRERLQQLKDNANTKLTKTMSQLELSFAPGWVGHPETTVSIGIFLESIGLLLYQALAQQVGGPINIDILEIVEQILLFAEDVSHVAERSPFDEAVFQTYHLIGQNMADNLGDIPSHQGLAASFSAALGLLNKSCRLTSGLSMEFIWQLLRPITPGSCSLSEVENQLKALADRFDAVTWVCGTSLGELVVLRNSILRVFDSLDSMDAGGEEKITGAQQALQKLCDEDILAVGEASGPFFRTQFEGLLQYTHCHEIPYAMSLNQDPHLSLLSCQPTRRLMESSDISYASRLFLQLEQCTGILGSRNVLTAVKGTLGLSMIQKITTISEVPLRSLEFLRVEMNYLATRTATMISIFGKNHLYALNSVLLHIHSEIIRVHEGLLERTSLAYYQRFIDDFVKSEADPGLQQPPTLEVQAGRRGSEYFSQVLNDYINPPLAILHDISRHGTVGLSDEILIATATAWIQFFVGCLILYLPNRIFDPAIRPLVEHDRLRQRRSEFEIELWALKEFEQVFTGQSTSLRIQKVQLKLDSLKDTIPNEHVSRPQPSTNGELQSVFNGVLDSVIPKCPARESLQRLLHGDQFQKSNVELLRTNIAHFIERLLHGFPTCQDLARPLINLLRGLSVGLTLALTACDRKSLMDDKFQSICCSTPFLGMEPATYEAIPGASRRNLNLGNDSHLRSLKVSAIFSKLECGAQKPFVRSTLEVFHGFYKDWKEQLSKDQVDQAAKTSLYRYQGYEEDQDEESSQEMDDLFPSLESGRDFGSEFDADPRSLAQKLAACHRDVFGGEKSSSSDVIDALKYAADSLGRLPQDLVACRGSVDKVLPALIIRLEDSCEALQTTSINGRMLDFYRDSNITEVRKLASLITVIQQRYLQLKKAWPEHATIHDVLNVSAQLLDMRHTEPVAKFLSKSEQLHSFMHEWQIVASPEFSAAGLYDQLTKLLVDWRRLELSAWARLLDHEDKKCSEDVDAWWFIAYETIVAVPLSLIDAGESVDRHTTQLLSTLTEFILTTSVGHYARRIQLIEYFKAHINILGRDLPQIKTIANALSNLISFYKRFEKSIQDLVQHGRKALEREVKEILLLASWKDTNINALKASAKLSHHKLFKIVRTYRRLLAQPARQVLLQTLPDMKESITSCSAPVYRQDFQNLDTVLRMCQQNWPWWTTKPSRYQDPLATARQMAKMSENPSSKLGMNDYVDDYSLLLAENIRSLQKAVPATGSEADKEILKHLKARKRKLFLNTLKDLRQMGFQSNMSGHALAKQATLPIIFAASPALNYAALNKDFEAADSHWYSMLDHLILIREKSQDLSKDLNHAEASRSLSYLESMLSVTLKERVMLASGFDELRHLDEIINAWNAVSNVEHLPFIVKQADRDQSVEIVSTRIAQLPLILETGYVLLEKHGRLGDIDNSLSIQRLRTWKDRITALVDMHENLAQLPSGLTSALHQESHRQAKTALKDLGEDLQAWTVNEPNVGFILRQLQLWTALGTANTNASPNGVKSIKLKEFDDGLNTACDSMLVAIQRMQTTLSAIPSGPEEPKWLTRTTKSLSGALRSLQIGEVTSKLENIMLGMQNLELREGQTFAIVSAACAVAQPIVHQYRESAKEALNRCVANHRALCKLARVLAQSYLLIITQGFCDPASSSTAESSKTDKLEEGMGLGEGQGAEDISKDIQDDEDLSELAQNKGKEEEAATQSVDEAVDMNQADLEGDLESASGDEAEDEERSGEEQENIEEESGSVDNLDPDAVDEKLWDSAAEHPGKEKEGEQGTGKNRKDKKGTLESRTDNETVDDEADDSSNDDPGKGEETIGREAQKLDPHVEEEQNLDLPEGMDLDDGDRGSMSDLHSDDFDKASDGAQEEINDREPVTEGTEPEETMEPEDKAEMETHQDDDNGHYAHESPGNEAESPVDTEPESDFSDQDQNLLPERADDGGFDAETAAPSEVRGHGQDNTNEDEENLPGDNSTQSERRGQAKPSDRENANAAAEEGGQVGAIQQEQGSAPNTETLDDTSGNRAFKKLGDILEQWHRHQREIRDASGSRDEARPHSTDVDMNDADFEHLYDKEARTDAQALGAATEEQAQTLDQRAFDSEIQDHPEDFMSDHDDQGLLDDQDEMMKDEEPLFRSSINGDQASKPSVFIGKSDRMDQDTSEISKLEEFDDEIPTSDNNPANPPTADTALSARSPSAARQLWAHYEFTTHSLSLVLTEQLRLILAPTQATKMRGDFRTGKRLNIKRIIPYIASNYKRDKIWMRRSVPQKRNYQVMLAVDDSKSMGESGSGQLAFEALVLVAKSLSMLEVGEIAVVGFGEDVKVAHEFDKPFSSEAGVGIIQQFGFKQTKTNVRKLVAESIDLFRDARAKASSSSTTELWQLCLIISDGICEDHETIRRLVRQAMEERIMIVFVIVDAIRGESIVDMSQAVFEPDPAAEGGQKLRIKRYLDGFPFMYYLVVGNVKELPGVLATALRSWFSEVVGTAG